jgi:hypothetical protein
VESVVELLQEYERTAGEVAASDLSNQPWEATQLRERVIEVLERGGRALAVVAGSDASPWSLITWTKADPPVALARALAVVHQRLSAAARPRRFEHGVLLEMPLRQSGPTIPSLLLAAPWPAADPSTTRTPRERDQC